MKIKHNVRNSLYIKNRTCIANADIRAGEVDAADVVVDVVDTDRGDACVFRIRLWLCCSATIMLCVIVEKQELPLYKIDIYTNFKSMMQYR